MPHGVSSLSPVPTGRMNAELLGVAVVCSSHPPSLATTTRIKSRAPVAVFACHVLLPAIEWPAPWRSTTIAHRRTHGDGESWDRVWQRFRADSCGTDRIFGSAINMAISDFSSLVGRTLKIDMSFASVLCGLTSLGQHTTLEQTSSYHFTTRRTPCPFYRRRRVAAGAVRLGLPVPAIKCPNPNSVPLRIRLSTRARHD